MLEIISRLIVPSPRPVLIQQNREKLVLVKGQNSEDSIASERKPIDYIYTLQNTSVILINAYHKSISRVYKEQ